MKNSLLVTLLLIGYAAYAAEKTEIENVKVKVTEAGFEPSNI